MPQETINIADAQETSRLIYNKYHPENLITTQRIIDDFYRNLMDGQPAAIKAITERALAELKVAKPTDAQQLEDAKIQADISFLDAVKAAVDNANPPKP